jgi:hypothetical protein
MIKISKDNLFFWRYFFGGGMLMMHVFFIIFVFAMNFWMMYVAYFIMALLQFGVGRVWRYLLIKDVYLSSDLKKIIFENSGNGTMEFSCAQIVKCSTKKGITDVEINDNGNVRKFYFMVNAKENLKYLK